MQRYAEFIAGTARKFYKVETDGADWIATWGRIGTRGQSKRFACMDEQAAEFSAESQFKVKLNGGYVERTELEALASVMIGEDELVEPLKPNLEAFPENIKRVMDNSMLALAKIAKSYNADKIDWAMREKLKAQTKQIGSRMHDALREGYDWSRRNNIWNAIVDKFHDAGGPRWVLGSY